MTQTCHTRVTLGMVCSPPPGSLLRPSRGGVQSEPGGWSNSNPQPENPLTAARSALYILGRLHSKYGPPGVGVGVGGRVGLLPVPPIPRCYGSDGVSAATLLLSTPLTLRIQSSPTVAPRRLVPSPSTAVCMITRTSSQAHVMDDMPC